MAVCERIGVLGPPRLSFPFGNYVNRRATVLFFVCLAIRSMAQTNAAPPAPFVGELRLEIATNSPVVTGYCLKSLTEERAELRGTFPIDSAIATDLLATNVVVRRALQDAKGAPDILSIARPDFEAICSLLGKLDKFEPWSGGGTVLRYPRFTIAIIPGSVADSNSFTNRVSVNAYLVRVPNHGWFFLETRRRPKPVVD